MAVYVYTTLDVRCSIEPVSYGLARTTRVASGTWKTASPCLS